MRSPVDKSLPPRLAMRLLLSEIRAEPSAVPEPAATEVAFPMTRKEISKNKPMAALFKAAVTYGIPVRWRE